MVHDEDKLMISVKMYQSSRSEAAWKEWKASGRDRDRHVKDGGAYEQFMEDP
jgi:hypothetical protein